MALPRRLSAPRPSRAASFSSLRRLAESGQSCCFSRHSSWLARCSARLKQFLDATERIRQKDVAILGAAGEVARERKDERLALAGELHDEVLPSLFKVHLMGQVLRQDLAAGKLLELDDDLPELLFATDAAQRAIRDLLGDLRRSPLGASGLIPTLRLLVDQLASAGAPPVTLDVEQFDSSPLAQLLAYQAIREALHNAAKHSQASSIGVRVWTDEALLRLSVTDDGTGFSWAAVDGSRHFGLQIMKERFEAAGGGDVYRLSPWCRDSGSRQCSEESPEK